MKVVLYSTRTAGRAGHVALAMCAGLRRHGVEVEALGRWDGKVRGDVAVAYGWINEPIFTAYRMAGGHFAYFDMGYFNRKPSGDKGGSREGHHRLAIDGWDTADTMRRGCPDDRWRALGIEVNPDRVGIVPHAILVAGMSGKAAGTHGFVPNQWERQTLDRVHELFPNVEVIFREKPKDLDAVEPIANVLNRVGLIITHHSNVAVDGLVAGVPCFARKGVGKLVSATDVAAPAPRVVEVERRALLADVAYAQWTPAEMRTGEAWVHIREILAR